MDSLFDRPTSWPTFMLFDPIANFHTGRVGEVAEHQLLLFEGDRFVGHTLTIPIAWDGPFEDLPDRGFDAIVEAGIRALDSGATTNVMAALEIDIDPRFQGGGRSTFALRAMRANAASHGYDDLVGPLRPTGKPLEPDAPMAEYMRRRRDDGLPQDPWLRVHVRLGARAVKVAPLSMTIVGTLAEWRTWTGLPLDRSGPVHVPGGLVPAWVSVEHDAVLYSEPGIWVHHDLRGLRQGDGSPDGRSAP
jgi:hypothetical protein